MSRDGTTCIGTSFKVKNNAADDEESGRSIRKFAVGIFASDSKTTEIVLKNRQEIISLYLRDLVSFKMPATRGKHSTELHREATRVLLRVGELTNLQTEFQQGILETASNSKEISSVRYLRSLMINTRHYECLLEKLALGAEVTLMGQERKDLESVQDLVAIISLTNTAKANPTRSEESWTLQVKPQNRTCRTPVQILCSSSSLEMVCKEPCIKVTSHYVSKIMEYLNNPRLSEKACLLQIKRMRMKYLSVLESGCDGSNLEKVMSSLNIPASDIYLLRSWKS